MGKSRLARREEVAAQPGRVFSFSVDFVCSVIRLPLSGLAIEWPTTEYTEAKRAGKGCVSAEDTEIWRRMERD